MGRGLASKGKRSGDGPDWLRPAGADDGSGNVRVAEEQPKKKRRDPDDDDDDRKSKKGIQWKPLAFLVLMILPGLAPVLLDVMDRCVPQSA